MGCHAVRSPSSADDRLKPGRPLRLRDLARTLRPIRAALDSAARRVNTAPPGQRSPRGGRLLIAAPSRTLGSTAMPRDTWPEHTVAGEIKRISAVLTARGGPGGVSHRSGPIGTGYAYQLTSIQARSCSGIPDRRAERTSSGPLPAASDAIDSCWRRPSLVGAEQCWPTKRFGSHVVFRCWNAAAPTCRHGMGRLVTPGGVWSDYESVEGVSHAVSCPGL
jgi:hypothetical protein